MKQGPLPIEGYLLKLVSIPPEVGSNLLSQYVQTNMPDLFPLPRSWEFGECFLLPLGKTDGHSKFLAWLVSKDTLIQSGSGTMPASAILAAATYLRGDRLLAVESNGFVEILAIRGGSAEVLRSKNRRKIDQTFAELQGLELYGIVGFEVEGYAASVLLPQDTKTRTGGGGIVHINPILERRRTRAKRGFFLVALPALVLTSFVLGGLNLSAGLEQADRTLSRLRQELTELGQRVQEEQDLIRRSEEIYRVLNPPDVESGYYERIDSLVQVLPTGDTLDTLSLQGPSVQFAGEFQDPVSLLSGLRESGVFGFVELLQSRPSSTGSRFNATFRGEFRQ